MLLEIHDCRLSASYLCESSVRTSVRLATEHVARISRMRAELQRLLDEVARTAVDSDSSVPNSNKRARTSESLADASTLLSSDAVSRKLVLSQERLEALLAVMCGDDATAAALCKSLIAQPPPTDAGLCFCGRWLEPDKLLCDYLGTNEKSKVKLSFGMMVPADTGDTNVSTVAASCSGAMGLGSAPMGVTPPSANRAPPQPTTQRPSTDSTVSLSSFFRRCQSGCTESGASTTADTQDAGANDDDDNVELLSDAQAAALTGSHEVRAV